MAEAGNRGPQEQPPLEVVELRVHGVHGTSPASMLGLVNDDVEQVAGDGITGVFRPKPSAQLPGRNLAGHPISVEAYSWGALTSGVSGLLGWVKRALWLVLLPFALANLAYWARLGLAEDSPQARWGARATRLGALLLTVFFVLTPCLLGVDLVAWQCYRWGSPSCSLPGALDFIGKLSIGRRLALGCLVPLAAIGVLAILSSTTLQRYEASEGPHNGGSNRVLSDSRLWKGKKRTSQLQRIHLAVALAVVVAFSGVHVIAVDLGTPIWIWLTVLPSVVVAAVAIGWSMVLHPDDVDHHAEHRSRIVDLRRRVPENTKHFLRNRLPDWLLTVMVGLTAGHLAALTLMGDSLPEERDFAGHNLWFIVVFVLLTAVHLSLFTSGRMSARASIVAVVSVLVLAGIALAVHSNSSLRSNSALLIVLGLFVFAGWLWLAIWHNQQGRRFRTEAWNGAGASLLLAAAVWVALLFTTGAVMVSADYLDASGHGVGDLVSQTSLTAVTASTPESAGPAQYVSTGHVLLDHAVLQIMPNEVDVLAGSVDVEALSRQLAAPNGTPAAVAAVGNAHLSSGRIVVNEPQLQLKNTCTRDPSKKELVCSAEDTDFVAAGTLDLAGRPLLIKGDHRNVTVVVANPPHLPLVVPQVLIWSPLVQMIWLFAVAAYVALAWLWFRCRCWPAIKKCLEADTDIPRQDRAAALKSRRAAALAHRAERLLDGIGVITAPLALAVIALSATGKAPWILWPWTRSLATLSMWVAAGIGLGLIYVASLMRTSESARRGLGILWDLTTFWPRAAHPLAPPCYAERVVPELHTRIDWVLYDRSGPPATAPVPRANSRVVLSGHSQGSAIVTAVLSRLSADQLDRVRVITYGSQIRALYGRVFPRVFGPAEIGYQPTPGPARLGDAFPDAGAGSSPAQPYLAPDRGADSPELPLMDRVFKAGGEWTNLFRRTDPLGYRIFADLDTARDRWVSEVPPVTLGDPGPVVLGHGGYQHSLTYRTIVAAWTEEQVVPDPTGTVDVPALPEG